MGSLPLIILGCPRVGWQVTQTRLVLGCHSPCHCLGSPLGPDYHLVMDSGSCVHRSWSRDLRLTHS